MTQKDGFCRVCSRGFYSCHWRKQSERTKKWSCCWFLFVSLVAAFSLCWIYICLAVYNSRDMFNWKLFTVLNMWVNWFMVVFIMSGVLTSYCVLLLLFALVQLALREKLDLHVLHKVFLFLSMAIFIGGGVAFTCRWKEELPTVPLLLQATAPFLQFGAVGALTLLSWIIFQSFNAAKKGSKFLIALIFLVVSAAIFLCPLLIKSPCLIAVEELPEKPKLIGHRGAPMSAPENTLMSFNKSIECGVLAFETDVQISKDKAAFLMHDHKPGFLERTTNVKAKFPHTTFNQSSDVTLNFLQSLNAGEWFLKTDPHQTVSQLSAEDKMTARNQVIPSLLQLLQLAKQHEISVIFDLYSSGENDTEITVDIILDSGINQSLILWLPPHRREYVKRRAPGFIQVYSNESDLINNTGRYLNVAYNALSRDKIRELRRQNVSVNLWVVNEQWLFSLLWCAGASSVTTNSCHLLKDMEHPDWVMTPSTYMAIWISLDVISVLIMICLYVIQLKHSSSRHETHSRKEQIPFLPRKV
ncbi:glycerophosphoinositol inositolphosphodiesterase GDPD2 [Nothobranchius furzeri]|uniref:Glycerophosphodiester phosphodiesterase domain containing 2 n=1 Tax=Nothobranchius furzeri TaxID=105023 RepID=A0A1A8B7K9_NOTFU